MIQGRYFKAVLFSCVLLCCFAAILFSSSKKIRVVVCPFQVVSDNMDKHDALRISAELKQLLGEIKSVNVADGALVLDYMRDMSVVTPGRVLSAAAKRVGAEFVLAGTVFTDDAGYSISVVAYSSKNRSFRLWRGNKLVLKQVVSDLFNGKGRLIKTDNGYFSQKLPDYVLIPSGTITQGNHPKTATRAEYNRFYASRRCVSNAEYKEFVTATKRDVPFVDAEWAKPFNWQNGTYPDGRADAPAVLVNWFDAVDYAKWKGLKLPDRTQWLAIAAASVSKRFFSYPGFFEWTASEYKGTPGVDVRYEDYLKPGEVLRYIFSGNFFHAGKVVPSRWALPYVSSPENRFAYVGFRCIKNAKGGADEN